MAEGSSLEKRFKGRKVLPTNVKPLHYSVSLQPNLSSFKYTGSVAIDLEVVEESRSISLNINNIQLGLCKLLTKEGELVEEISADKIEINEADEILKICLSESLSHGQVVKLVLEFESVLNDKLKGFYRSHFIDGTGKEKVMACTQFAATDARMAFPCWDEPHLKATFDVVLEVPHNLTALSNMNVVSEVPIDDNLKRVTFATSPVMSTYLLAFIVAELDYIEAFTTVGTPIPCRVYGPIGAAQQGKFALEICTRSLDLYNKVFGSPYPLPKMDMVPVADFEAGAMENWGLVTYRTSCLMVDEANTTQASKQRIALIVAHELAHQWFGNLVTMEWWNDLWLNEGFATWVGNYAVDKLFPEWNYWNNFVVDDVQRGMSLDCLRSSHPIEVEVKDPAQIGQIFDAISYSKGGSVIRMLSAYLTEDVFLEGIRQYLKKHAYGNASTSDLWAQLSETSGQDISEFMNLWTKQTGYPVLRVEQNGNILNITQNRFLASGDTNENEDKQLWWNPLGLLTSGQTKASQEILHQKMSEIHLPENSDYFILNYGFNSIFRVQYPSENLKKLGELIAKKEVLSSVDRVALVSDAGYLAQAGYASTTDLLELLLNFQNEEEYVVWREISTQLSSLTSLLFEQPESVKTLLKRYRLKLFSEIAHKLGWVPQATDKSSTPMLRALAISNAGKAGDPSIVSEAKSRFNRYIEGDKSAIPADLKFTVFQIVLSQGSKEEYNKIKKLYLDTSSTDLKLVTLTALGTTPNRELIQETLQFGLSEHVRSQDLSRVFIYCGSNSNGRRLTWSFAKAHWGLLVENFASSLSSLNHIIKSSIAGLTEQSDIDDVKQFFNGKDTKAFNMSLNQSLESVAINISWLQRDGEHVINWLESKFA